MLRTAAPPGLHGRAGKAARTQLTGREAEELRLRTQQILLAIGMLIAGTANTVTCKAALSTVSENAPFNHPFVMSGCMFCGEILCLVWHNIRAPLRRWRTGQPPTGGDRQMREDAAVPKHIFALPALCDILGTSVMYVGLTLTTASTYQMLRGSVIIFTGALSATYLRRKQWAHHWVAIAFVFLGVLTVGTASSALAAADAQSAGHGGSSAGGSTGGSNSSAGDGDDQSRHATERASDQALLGAMLVVASQVFTALQMCLEERFVTGYDLPAVRQPQPPHTPQTHLARRGALACHRAPSTATSTAVAHPPLPHPLPSRTLPCSRL